MKKNLKETNLVLEACKKEYQKLYLAPRKFEKKKKNEEQQDELLKYRSHYKGRTTNKAPAPQDKKIKLSDIEFDKEKLRNLLTAQKTLRNRGF